MTAWGPGVGHNWSGFPGAWCLNCGAECWTEICVGTCDVAPLDIEGYPDPGQCPVHGNQPPCPEPGSNRNNPYIKREQ